MKTLKITLWLKSVVDGIRTRSANRTDKLANINPSSVSATTTTGLPIPPPIDINTDSYTSLQPVGDMATLESHYFPVSSDIGLETPWPLDEDKWPPVTYEPMGEGTSSFDLRAPLHIGLHTPPPLDVNTWYYTADGSYDYSASTNPLLDSALLEPPYSSSPIAVQSKEYSMHSIDMEPETRYLLDPGATPSTSAESRKQLTNLRSRGHEDVNKSQNPPLGLIKNPPLDTYMNSDQDNFYQAVETRRGILWYPGEKTPGSECVDDGRDLARSFMESKIPSYSSVIGHPHLAVNPIFPLPESFPATGACSDHREESTTRGPSSSQTLYQHTKIPPKLSETSSYINPTNYQVIPQGGLFPASFTSTMNVDTEGRASSEYYTQICEDRAHLSVLEDSTNHPKDTPTNMSQSSIVSQEYECPTPGTSYLELLNAASTPVKHKRKGESTSSSEDSSHPAATRLSPHSPWFGTEPKSSKTMINTEFGNTEFGDFITPLKKMVASIDTHPVPAALSLPAVSGKFRHWQVTTPLSEVHVETPETPDIIFSSEGSTLARKLFDKDWGACLISNNHRRYRVCVLVYFSQISLEVDLLGEKCVTKPGTGRFSPYLCPGNKYIIISPENNITVQVGESIHIADMKPQWDSTAVFTWNVRQPASRIAAMYQARCSASPRFSSHILIILYDNVAYITFGDWEQVEQTPYNHRDRNGRYYQVAFQSHTKRVQFSVCAIPSVLDSFSMDMFYLSIMNLKLTS